MVTKPSVVYMVDTYMWLLLYFYYITFYIFSGYTQNTVHKLPVDASGQFAFPSIVKPLGKCIC